MTATTTDRAPGVYAVEENTYHRGPELSVSGAKTLLKSPARYLYEREHGRPAKDAFDLGTLAHELILRGGDKRLRVIDAYDWRTKKAQDAKRAAYAAGHVPVHRGDLRQAARIAQAVRRHPVAGAILRQGQPEQSIYWTDEATGVALRGRIDWAHPKALVDVKSTGYGGSEPDEFARTAARFDYPMQAANYTDGWAAITGQVLPFLFVVVEVEPPHFVEVYQLEDHDLDAGRERMRRAIDLYATYERDGWPPPDADIRPLTLPRWYAA